MTYKEKLLDPRWQKKRLEILNRDGFACQLCQATEDTLHIHHVEYTWDANPWDYPADQLKTLCLHCHWMVEQLKKEGWDVLGIIRMKAISGSGENLFYLTMSRPEEPDLKAISICWTKNGEYKSSFIMLPEYLEPLRNLLNSL